MYLGWSLGTEFIFQAQVDRIAVLTIVRRVASIDLTHYEKDLLRWDCLYSMEKKVIESNNKKENMYMKQFPFYYRERFCSRNVTSLVNH